jgi:hypothetical protein
MLNVGLAEPPHICEIQVVHHELLVARKGLPGHSIYNAVRNCTELLEYAGVGAADGRSMRVARLAAGRSSSELGQLAGKRALALPNETQIHRLNPEWPCLSVCACVGFDWFDSCVLQRGWSTVGSHSIP